MPTVSVLLSVYNGAKTLPRCLNSIEQQTFKDISLVCIDDGSSDTSLAILHDWRRKHPDRDILILRNEKNQGLTRSLKQGEKHAKGTYLARLDADDWWLPEKIARQVAYLETHRDIGIVGCWYINVRPHKRYRISLPVSDADIRQKIFWRNPFGHSCVVIRKSVFDQVGGFDVRLRYGQDRDLWFRLLPATRLANLPQVLCYRQVDSSVSTTKTRAQIWQQVKTVHKYIILYRASPFFYLSLIEPLLVFSLPTWLRLWLRSSYDRLSPN